MHGIRGRADGPYISDRDTVESVYHGTSAESARIIEAEGFEPSEGEEHRAWLGRGVYVFCVGRTPVPPAERARMWAVTEAYDPGTRGMKYSRYAVMEVGLRTDPAKTLDLTSSEGLKIFDYLFNRYVMTIRNGDVRVNLRGKPRDGDIIDRAIKSGLIDPDFVRADFYIRFREERMARIDSKIPNCTIGCVKNPACIVSVNTTKQGEI